MLKITPEDEVMFTKLDGGTIGGEIEILNTTSNPIAFKIKTTSPDKFRVRPSSGIVPANANKFINVVLSSEQQANASLIKDKFLIMSMELRPDQGDVNETELTELWKKTTANSSNVKQHRLMCFYNPTGNGGILRNRGAKRDNAFNHSLNGNCSDHELSSLSSDSYVISQLIERNIRLEKQVKLNRGLQLATLFVVLLLLVGVLYIINIMLHSSGSGYCIKR